MYEFEEGNYKYYRWWGKFFDYDSLFLERKYGNAKEFMRKVMEVIILVETRINEKNEYE